MNCIVKFPEFRTEILPPYFGGAPADMLIGGEEIRLAPIILFIVRVRSQII